MHKIHVGPGGTFEPSGDLSTSPSEIDTLFQSLREKNAKALTLHFHGGLVDEAAGDQIANNLRPVYAAAGTYPIGFVWDTGLIETLRQNIATVNQTKLFQKLLKWVIKRTAERFGGLDGRGAGVPVSADEIEAELAEDMPFADYDNAATGQGAAKGGDIAIIEADLELVREELEAEFQELVDGDEEIDALLAEKQGETAVDTSSKGLFSSAKIVKSLARIAFRVIRRHVRKRDHGFYPTIVEEILRELYLADLGAWVWGGMKNKAEAMSLPNDGLSGEEQHVGSYFLEHLNTLLAERDVVVNLVGHSAGSIVISHLFGALHRYPNVSFGTIAFLAPAATCDLAVNTLLRQRERYSSFRMYTMSDHFERNDMLVKGVYTRSLLYFISGVLEPDMVDKPVTGMMRFSDRKPPFDDGVARAWADYIHADSHLALADSTVINPDAEEAFRSSSRTHGGFDNDSLTLASLTALLKA